MKINDILFTNYQRTCLAAFASSIKEANRFGAHKWGVILVEPRQIRLHLGSLIVATIEQSSLWLAVDLGETSAHNRLNDLMNWAWTSQFFYKRPPSKSGYYWPMNNHPRVWPTIQNLHFQYLSKAAEVYDHLRVDSQPNHSNEVVKAIASYLRETLPLPDYRRVNTK